MDSLTTIREGLSNSKELIYFYMDGCKYCKDFSPIWDEFVTKYQGPLQLKKIERKQAGEELLGKHGVTGFPTVILVDENGKKKDEFNGERTVQGLEVFAK